MNHNFSQLTRLGLLALGMATWGGTAPALAVILPTAPPTMQVGRAGNNLNLTVKGAPNSSFAIYSSATGDRNGTWNYVTSVTTDSSGMGIYTVGLDSGPTQLFYSAKVSTGSALLQVTSLNSGNDVFSLNVVGYVNVFCPPGFSLISNPLKAATNSLPSVIPSVPPGTQFYFYDTVTGYSAYTFDDVDLAWTPNATGKLLEPGGGGFIKNNGVTNIPITFVGEVLQGSLTNPCPAGFAIRSSKIPVVESLNSMNFPANPGDLVFIYSNFSGYSAYSFDDVDLIWTPGNPNGPTISVAQAFFTKQLQSKTWVRNFTVQ